MAKRLRLKSCLNSFTNAESIHLMISSGFYELLEKLPTPCFKMHNRDHIQDDEISLSNRIAIAHLKQEIGSFLEVILKLIDQR